MCPANIPRRSAPLHSLVSHGGHHQDSSIGKHLFIGSWLTIHHWNLASKWVVYLLSALTCQYCVPKLSKPTRHIVMLMSSLDVPFLHRPSFFHAVWLGLGALSNLVTPGTEEIACLLLGWSARRGCPYCSLISPSPSLVSAPRQQRM